VSEKHCDTHIRQNRRSQFLWSIPRILPEPPMASRLSHGALLTLIGIQSALADVTPAVKDPLPWNGLAKTPPMGWSSWNYFADNINESIVISTIDYFVNSGLKDAGYQFVNLDDGWQRYKGDRKHHPGNIEYDPVKFPRGIKYLADYAHSKGLKMGIYNGPGQQTCAGYTGSEGHEAQDAQTFADWGIDHLKYDSCCSHENATAAELQPVVRKMALSLRATKRDIVYHACHCGWADIWKWAADEGANHWRIGQDIPDEFNYPGNREDYYYDVLDMLDHGAEMANYSAPGRWNDFDMLIVGLDGKGALTGLGCSNVEYRAHFTMWCMVASPLLIGSDVRQLSAYDLETLTNMEVIAVGQDPLGIAGVVVAQDKTGGLQYYAKKLYDGSYAVAFLNRNTETASMSFNPLSTLNLPWSLYSVHDLWAHRDMGHFTKSFSAELIAHDAKMFRISPA
jgi:alpha-galactosidase